MSLTKHLIIFLFLFTFSFLPASADVADIDADVIANVTFNDNVGGDALMQSINISWNATYSGYLYFFAHDSYYGSQSVVNAFTGNPNDNIELGIMDDPTFYGYQLRGWRIGYVYSGTTYNIGGSIYEPGTDDCGGGPGAYFREHGDWSYSGGYTGHEVSLSPGRWNACAGGDYPVGFLLIEAPPPISSLSGYIKNTEGTPVHTYPYLNNSDSTESDDITGYYEFTDLDVGSYLISIDGFVYDDYNAVVAVSGPTEHNITLTRQSPILSIRNIYPEQNEMLLTWTRNVVVSDVLIYRGTDTNLIGTVGSGSYLTGFFQDESVACGTPYNYWLQPMDDTIAGPKYALNDTTDPCDVSAIVPIFTPTPTPTKTPDDDDNDEESLIEIIDKIIDEIIDDAIEFFDETIIEPSKVVIEEVVVHATSTFNWVLLGFVYLSTLAGKIINGRENAVRVIVDTALYGTLAVIFILFLSFIGFSIIFSNELIAVVIFVVVGFVFGILPEFIKSDEILEKIK